MPEFFQTQMGHKFFESTMPRIASALESLAERQAAPSPSIPPDPVIERIRRLVTHLDRAVPTNSPETQASLLTQAVRKALRDDIDYMKGALQTWEEAKR